MTKTTIALTLTCSSLFLLPACNAHPIKPSEMQHWGGGAEAGDSGDDSGEESGDDSGDDDGDSGGDGTGGETPCEGVIDVTAHVPNVMLVLDESSSMKTQWTPEGAAEAVSRYNSVYEVVDNLTADFDGEMNFGAMLFPARKQDNPAGERCTLADAPEVPMGSDQTVIDELIDPADVELQRGTPAAAAYLKGYANLASFDAEGRKVIVLVTDGEPTCEADEGDKLVERIGIAADAGMSTYVVGIDVDDGTEDLLASAAQAGETARPGDEPFYNAFSQEDLQAALDEIGSRVECTVDLPEALDDDSMEVTVAGASYGQVHSCDTEDGWRFVGNEGPYQAIELCGAACDTMHDAGQLEYSCGDQYLPEG